MEDHAKKTNTKLQHERLLRGWSQKKIGLEIGTSKEMVSRWETGERAPSLYYQERLCNLFGLTAEELGFIELPQQAKKSLTMCLQELPSIPIHNTIQNTIAISHGKAEDALGLSRRQVLHGMLNTACTTLVLAPYAMLNSDAVNRLAMIVLQHFNVDNAVLDDLNIITQQYWRLTTNLSIEVLSGIQGHFSTIIHLLRRSQPTTVSKRLYSIASESAQIIGKVLFDAHEYELAWSYYSFALHASQSSQNQHLYAACLGRMSLLAISNNQPQEALSLLKNSPKLTLQNNRISAWLSVIEAEAHAHLDNINSFTRAMGQSECIALESPLEEDVYATGFSLSRLAGYKGSCYLRLNKVESSLAALQEAYSLLDPFYMRRKSVILAHMGTAYAKMGNAKKAYDCACQSLTIITQTGSLDTLKRIYILRASLHSQNENTLVNNLDQQIQFVRQQIHPIV